MSVTLPTGGKVTLTASYVDANGNPAEAPSGATISWTNADTTVATLESATGPTVTEDAIGAFGASTAVSATDGTLSTDPNTPFTITIGAGPATKIVIAAGTPS